MSVMSVRHDSVYQATTFGDDRTPALTALASAVFTLLAVGLTALTGSALPLLLAVAVVLGAVGLIAHRGFGEFDAGPENDSRAFAHA